MSVQQAAIVAGHGGDEHTALVGYPGYLLAALTAGHVREQRQGVHPNPLPPDPAHTFVFGDKPRGVRRALAQNARWIVPPKQPRG